MLYAFTDESYSPRQYFQAAYIVNEEQLPQIEKFMEELLHYVRAFGIEGDVEFHGHAIMNAKDEWKQLKGRFHLKVAVFKFFVEQLMQIDGLLIIESADVANLREVNNQWLTPHQETSKKLLKSINEYAETLTSDVYVFSDKISKEDRKRVQLDVLSHQYTYPRIKSVEFVASSTQYGIQITDMCIYLYRRLMDHSEVNRKTRVLVEELWKSLEPLLQR
jgi:hypothetical protein